MNGLQDTELIWNRVFQNIVALGWGLTIGLSLENWWNGIDSKTFEII